MSSVLPDDAEAPRLHHRLYLVPDVSEQTQFNFHGNQAAVRTAYLYSAPGLHIAIASSSACFVTWISFSESVSI